MSWSNKNEDNDDDSLLYYEQDRTTSTAWCHLISLYPYLVFENNAKGDDKRNAGTTLVTSGFESAFATYLAVQHLNNGDGSIIQDVENLPNQCPTIQFSNEFLDTQYNDGIALNALMKRILLDTTSTTNIIDKGEESNYDSMINSNSTQQPEPIYDVYLQQKPPCAFLGAYRSSITEPTSALTSALGYPQVSGMSTSSDLDSLGPHSLLARTIPSDAGTASVLAEYYIHKLGIRHLCVIATNDSFGNAYATQLRKAIAQWQDQEETLHFSLQQISLEVDVSNIRQVMETLKDLQYRYVFVAHSIQTHKDIIMGEAHQQNLIQNYAWMFSDGFAGSFTNQTFPSKNHPLYQAYRGVGTIEATGGFPGINPKYDVFAEQMLELKHQVVSNPSHPLRALLPRHPYPSHYPEDVSALLNSDDFLNPLSDGRVPLIYEATIMLGLAACQAATKITRTTMMEVTSALLQDETTNTNTTTTTFLHLNGQKYYDALVSFIQFQGMSGWVALDPQTGSRITNTTLFRLVNLVQDDDDDEVDEEYNTSVDGTAKAVRFKLVNSQLYTSGSWETIQDYIYQDGTSQPPLDIPPAQIEFNHISTHIRAIALIFCVCIILLAMSFWSWTWYKRNTSIVRASQPIFLYLVCVGSIIVACTIIPMTFDARNVRSKQSLTIACTSTIWLLSLGVGAIFSALFAKAYRINTIMRSAKRCRRIKVSIRDTLIPIAIHLSLNLLILSLMTALDPVEYLVTVLSYDEFGRTVETFGSCEYSTDQFAFTIPLFVLNFGMLGAAAFQSWQSRNLSTEYQESQHIFRALFGILLVVFIGGPVLFIAQENSNSHLFVSSAIIFVACLLILLLIFVPKIQYERQRRSTRRGIMRISGLDLSGMSAAGLGRTTINDNADDNRTSGQTPSSLGLCLDDESEASGYGERIFSNKTRSQLVDEVETLKRYIRVLKQRKANQINPSNPVEPKESEIELANEVDALLEEDDSENHSLSRRVTVQLSVPESRIIGGNTDNGTPQATDLATDS